VVGVVGVDDAGPARDGQAVTGDLDQAPVVPTDDHELVAHDPAPHLGALVPLRSRVADRPETDGLVVADPAGLAQRGCVGIGGQHVQQPAFLDDHVGRSPAGLPVLPAVDPLPERVAGSGQLGEAPVVVAQVRLGGDQVRLGDLDGRLGAALGLGVIGPARLDLAAVMTPQSDHLGMADGHAGDVFDRHRLLVVGVLFPSALCGRGRLPPWSDGG
jgi:hypothetical protein